MCVNLYLSSIDPERSVSRTLVITQRKCIVIGAEADEIRKGDQPDAYTKEGSNIHESSIVDCEIVEPHKMVHENKHYADVSVAKRPVIFMHCTLPQLARKAGLSRLIKGNVFKLRVYTP